MSNILSEFRELANYNLFSPFFIIALSFIIISVILLVINTRLKSKVIEIIYCSILVVLLIFVFYFYRNIILSFFDTIVESILKSLFFPSLLHEVFMLIFTSVLLFYVIKYFNRKKWLTITTIIVCGLLLILEVISLIVIANADNIYYAYKNKASLIIMESSAFIFYLNIIFFVIFRVKYRKNKKQKEQKDNNKPNLTEDGLEILTLD